MVNELGSSEGHTRLSSERAPAGPSGEKVTGSPGEEASSAEAPRVRLDPDVCFRRMQVAGAPIVRCEHLGTGQHFQFGLAEHHVALCLDGTRSISEVVALVQRDGLDWTPQDVAQFVGVLVAQKLALVQTSDLAGSASDGDRPNPQRPGIAAASPPLKRLVATVVRLCAWTISIRIPLMRATEPADRMLVWTRPLWAAPGMAVAGAVIAASLGWAAVHREQLAAEWMRLFHSPMWLWMPVLWIGLKVIHELGHATAARAHGVSVGKAGVTFFLLAPLAYVDVTHAWRLPRRRDRVQIALAGVLLELLVASAAVWFWWLAPSGMIRHLAAQVFVLAGPATLLVNANPLLRLDGYYVVSDAADIPNLRLQGRQLLGGWLQRRWLGMQSTEVPLSGWRRPFAAIHAAASVIFQVVWMGGLIVAVSLWAGPVGLIIAASASLLWIVMPAAKVGYKIWTYTDGSDTFDVWSHRRRVLWSLLTIALLVQFVVTLPSPVCRTVPVVVRYADDQILRSPADGFIADVRVQPGQWIRTGERILQLDERELALQCNDATAELEAEQIRWQQQQQQQTLGLAEASSRKIESLQRRRDELMAQRESLKVVAEREGNVLTPDIDGLQGRFVRRGEVLVQIGVPGRKELLISIGEEDVDAYATALALGRPLPVLFRQGRRVEIQLQPMRPRATCSIPHPALAANADGPLPVTARNDANDTAERFELISPRFEAVAPMSPLVSQDVRAGEIGKLALQDKRSLLTRFWAWFTHRSIQAGW